ncbi:MAG TPA: hypothetical protein VF988_15835 [Verrucomicrobiae bacterium]
MKTAALFILTALQWSIVTGWAGDRYDALSQIETRNNDRFVGPQREVSRYQILPALWNKAWSDREKSVARPTDPVAAKKVVMHIMTARCGTFKERYHRLPDDFEFYILWHRPACYLGRPPLRPITTVEADRAQRFANLCQSGEQAKSPGPENGKLVLRAVSPSVATVAPREF